MPVDPFLEPLLADLPPTELPSDGNWSAWRDTASAASNVLMTQVGETGPEVPVTLSVTIPVDAGSIDLRIYRPADDAPLPIHLFLHGGGWVGGDISLNFVEAACRERAVGASCVVVAVNYRKSPEHQFPVPLNDCHAALTWAIEHAQEFNGRPDLVTIGGQSAGANLAAALCLKLRDQEGEPTPALQLLEVPALDLTLSQPSTATYGTGYGLETREISQLLDLYLPDRELVHHPYASPLLAPDLSGLPPAHIMSAEFDPLRDDGERYTERLQAAGVRAAFSLQHGHIHGSAAFTKVMETARTWRAEALQVLRRVHSPSGS